MFSVMCSYNTSKSEQYCIQLLYVMHAIAISDVYTVRGVLFDRLFAAAICRDCFAESYIMSAICSRHERIYLYKRALLSPLLCCC